MKTVVFDIDGTLTETNRIDSEAFLATAREILGITVEPDWSRFAEVTDEAILSELTASNTPHSSEELASRFRRHFFEVLSDRANAEPEAFRPVPGALRIFGRARKRGWSVALATGAWRRSAEIKLRAADIPVSGIPVVSSSDHAARATIVREAIRLAGSSTKAARAVYVGDGVWDLNAARALGIGFVGRARGDAARSLRELGAAAVFPDFTDSSSFLDRIEEGAGESGASGSA